MSIYSSTTYTYCIIAAIILLIVAYALSNEILREIEELLDTLKEKKKRS